MIDTGGSTVCIPKKMTQGMNARFADQVHQNEG